MNFSQQKQSNAVNELHDISQYASYIDRRIYKLNQLYRSLEVNKKKRSKKQLKKITNVQKPQRISISGRFYQTIEDGFPLAPQRQSFSKNQTFWNTQYRPQRKKFLDSISNSRIRSQLKSDQIYRTCQPNQTMTSFYRTSRKANTSKDEGNRQRLKYYQNAKQQMLNTFYVGGGISTPRKGYQPEKIRYSECMPFDNKAKRGRVWHGRPPVKIIEKYD